MNEFINLSRLLSQVQPNLWHSLLSLSLLQKKFCLVVRILGRIYYTGLARIQTSKCIFFQNPTLRSAASRSQNPSLAAMAASMLRSGHRLFLRRQRLSAAFSTASAEELIDVRKLPTDYDPSTFDPSSPSRPPPSDRVWRLVEDVSSLTLAESAALSSLLLRRLDIPSAPPIAILNSAAGLGGGGTAGAAGEKAAAAAEKTVFELRLEAFDAASKIKVIKEIRTFTDLGLKEAKELVEKAPAVIKDGVSKEDAEAIVERMKAVGAKVVMD
ncbi:hypothetical protein PVAP13_3NG182840 [Panicum virgatum]|uniref:Large ribosomal subunit protein bL12 C-terminal domain-containing protein n=2 Tax=Panicum virgatum TaxID=38727 RepID=A0A8T0U9G8_PANVG|nr:hypothetical protein PVAP13_3NG182840 [Panicum virgatum]KAG2617663.1 hypothetical protein PVAP13_3NG182840 [Panicum virgatum]